MQLPTLQSMEERAVLVREWRKLHERKAIACFPLWLGMMCKRKLLLCKVESSSADSAGVSMRQQLVNQRKEKKSSKHATQSHVRIDIEVL